MKKTALALSIIHIFKKLVFDNIKACFLHLPVRITEKSSALRRRTTLSTQPFIYRILVWLKAIFCSIDEEKDIPGN